MATPYDTILLDEATSTQDLATAEHAKTGRTTLVVAARQTAGRGRSGNDWWQAPLGVAASLAFETDAVSVGDTFPLTVGLAVRRAIADASGIEVSLKWPNDIELHGGKVGGILVERDDRRVVVGCGLNLWWPDRPRGTAALCADEPDLDLGAIISSGWATHVMSTPAAWDHDSYVAACSTIGEELTWQPNGRGVATGIDDRGGLMVMTTDGPTTIRSGEVRMIRRAD